MSSFTFVTLVLLMFCYVKFLDYSLLNYQYVKAIEAFRIIRAWIGNLFTCGFRGHGSVPEIVESSPKRGHEPGETVHHQDIQPTGLRDFHFKC